MGDFRSYLLATLVIGVLTLDALRCHAQKINGLSCHGLWHQGTLNDVKYKKLYGRSPSIDFIHKYFTAAERNKRVKTMYQCIDTIFVETPSYKRIKTNRTKPRSHERFKLYSSAYSFLPVDVYPEKRRFSYSNNADAHREICASPSSPKQVRIHELHFYPFIDDPLLYPYAHHQEIERVVLHLKGRMMFPGLLSKHSNLRELDIAGGGAPEEEEPAVLIEGDLSLFQNLVSLRIYDCNVEITNELRGLQSIKYLWIEGYALKAGKVGLKELPKGILEMKDLEVLNLFNNPIERLPDELIHLKKLRVLSLQGTNVTAEEAHRIADQMPNLKYLWHD